MSDYQPIACGLYDQYELACLHQDNLNIKLNSGEQVKAKAINVYHQKGTGEWLEVEVNQVDGEKERQRIRLDTIASFEKV